MKIVALFLNIILFGFVCLVLVTDGLPREVTYIAITIGLMLTLILNFVVIAYFGAGNSLLNVLTKRSVSGEHEKIEGLSSTSAIMRIVAILCNIIFLGFVCWALADQYSTHPKEEGLTAFIVLMLLTPIISLVVLFIGGTRGRLHLQMKPNPLEKHV